ncbi:XdhC family protein [Flavobacterium sp. 1355]|uniref:XdhC family protein n=1 Tax=Flavobacterium sp. 1355 TaxID=2806571 RepID=UPI001AE42C8C|nr:XdhC/CoxI family protein [Flavobacterium sp. 1355]
MKEINEILQAYSEAKTAQKKAALATVVKVEGSSYRQPGARMLVTEDGLLTGAISGGCLEGDALKKALLSINQKQNKLITYNTSNEDDSEVGLQLGCNGIVHILFEYINDDEPNNPIHLLRQLKTQRKDAVVATVFSLKRTAAQIGTILFYRENTEPLYGNPIALQILKDVEKTLHNKASTIIKLEDNPENEVLIEYISPPVLLVIAGAGNDVQPLAKVASILGWEIIVGEGRATHATKRRFPEAKEIIVAAPEQLVQEINIDSQTYFTLMTHNYKYDLEVLKQLLKRNCNYIGVLGPRTKLNRMLNELGDEGIIPNEEQLKSIHGPIGLDIGSETSEEIALAIVAEIKAVMSGANGSSLKYKKEKIHTVKTD